MEAEASVMPMFTSAVERMQASFLRMKEQMEQRMEQWFALQAAQIAECKIISADDYHDMYIANMHCDYMCYDSVETTRSHVRTDR